MKHQVEIGIGEHRTPNRTLFWDGTRWRTHRVMTFHEHFPFYLIQRIHPFNRLLRIHRPRMRLLYDIIINKWMIYDKVIEVAPGFESKLGHWVHIMTLETEPTTKTIFDLKNCDWTRGGTVSMEKANKDINDLLALGDPKLVDAYRRCRELSEEMIRELDWIERRGLGRALQKDMAKKRKKKAVFVGIKTGKVLGIKDMPNDDTLPSV